MRAHKTYDSLGRGMEEEDIALMHSANARSVRLFKGETSDSGLSC